MNVLPEPHRAYSPTHTGGSARLSIAASACARGCGHTQNRVEVEVGWGLEGDRELEWGWEFRHMGLGVG